jgi:Protein of unknown function (DUF3106)
MFHARLHFFGACLLIGAALVPAAGWAASEVPGSGPVWSSLSAEQRGVLGPLASDWDNMDADRKQKWLEIANRFPTMPAARQERVQQRMGEWARMSPQQRTEARSNFQRSKQLPSEERQAQWEAYRALSPEERQALAERSVPGKAGGPDATAPLVRPLRNAPVDMQARKSNIVGETPTTGAPARPAASRAVQGNPGATTSLMPRPPAPPAHQQAGMPKIAASPGMVDRATLLPKRGPQAAAVGAVPEASGAKR